MNATSELAGYLAAHAIWCVSNGDMLIPMLAYCADDGERKLERLLINDFAIAVETGKRKLDANTMAANDAVLVFDGFIPIDEEKHDAIIVEMRCYRSPGSKAVIAVPYTPVVKRRFLVHTPRILTWEQCGEYELDEAMDAFFQGVESHEKGSQIWYERLDESK